MHKWTMRTAGALFFAGALVIAGCSGEDGKTGPQGAAGQDGQDGQDGQNGLPGQDGQDVVATAKPESCAVCHGTAGAQHQGIYDQYTDATLLSATVDGVASSDNGNGTFASTLTVTITGPDGRPLVDPSVLTSKSFWAGEYDATAGKFTTAKAFSFGSTLVPTATAGQFTLTAAAAPFAPEASASAFVFGSIATGTPVVSPKGRVAMYPDNYNFGTPVPSAAVDYVSAANVAGCEACHGKPYRKHGNIGPDAVGLAEFVSCKSCHTDQRTGGHADWQLLADDPAAYAAQDGVLTDAQKTRYAYTANLMNDVHMSHAMEFAYPQSMANCVTCHAGKLGTILADTRFTLTTCKSCHPVTGTNGDPKRAPALTTVVPHSTLDLYTYTGTCNGCHQAAASGGIAPTFAQIHTGYDKAIYKDATTKFSSVVTTKVDSASFDAATNRLTVAFSVAGADAGAIVKPTVVVSLYGYDTKDFVISGHGSQADGLRNLEWVEASTRNSNRLTVDPAVAVAGGTTWTATADLSAWAGMVADGTVKNVQVAVLPTVGLDQAQPVSTTNPAIAIAGATATVDLVGNAIVTGAYGTAIVDTAKCNKCHEALGTTFHSPSYGSATVVACRTCHTVRDGGSHLELQSRSIDSYIHAIHSMQPFDIGDIDFSDPVASLRYNHHVESTYPNFTLLNCESCHNADTYEVPDQSRSLPGVLSGSDTADRNIGAFPSVVTGAGSRACGSCHRAEMINEDAAGDLAAFNQHTATFGFELENGTGVFDAAVAKIMALFQ